MKCYNDIYVLTIYLTLRIYTNSFLFWQGRNSIYETIVRGPNIVVGLTLILLANDVIQLRFISSMRLMLLWVISSDIAWTRGNIMVDGNLYPQRRELHPNEMHILSFS